MTQFTEKTSECGTKASTKSVTKIPGQETVEDEEGENRGEKTTDERQEH